MVPVGRHARRWVAYAAFGIAALLLSAVLAAHAQDDQNAGSRHVAKASLSNAVESPTSAPTNVILLNADEIEQKAVSDARDIRDKQPADWWARILAMGAVVIAAVQTGVFGFQALMLRRTVSEGRDAIAAAVSAAEASQRSAKAAEDAVAKSDEILTHAQESSQKELRAYVFLEEIEVKMTVGSAVVTMKFKNSGQTPAYKAKIYGHIAKVFWPIGPVLSVSRDSPEISDEPIGPGMPRFKYDVTVLGQTDQGAFTSGSLALVVWGEVEYKDTFDITRHTYYRYFCGGSAGLRPILGQDGQFHGVYGMSAHQLGNDAD